MSLGDGHQERVELVEERRVAGQVRLDMAPERFVADLGRHDSVAGEHAARVGVGDEDGPPQGIEQDGVGRLWSDASHREKLRSESLERRSAQPLDAAAGPLQEEVCERVKAARLEAPRPRGADEPSQPRERQPAEPPGREPPRGAEIVQAVCWVSTAPTATSKRLRAGHQS